MALAHSPKIVTDGLVLCLDAADPKSYPGSGTAWTDRSGNGSNGTLTNGPTFDSTNGGSIDFDGTNDYIAISHDSSQSFSGDFSIEAVIKSEGSNANCIIQKGSGNDYFQEYWLLQDMRGNNNQFIFIMAQSGNSNATYLNTSSILSLNTYYHVVVTVSGSTSKIFVDGEQKATGSISSRSQSTADLRIGWRVDGFAATNGKIPITKLYNKALTAAEVLQNYNATKGRFS